MIIIHQDLSKLELRKEKKMKNNKVEEPTTTLLEDLEDLVGQLQSDKISEKQTIEILSNIVEFEKGKVSNEK